MHKVNTIKMVELTWSSSKGRFGAGKEISEELGRKPESTDLNERHPFDVEILRIPPGKAPRGVVRHKDGTTPVDTVALRWRTRRDNGGSSEGWRIDTLQSLCEGPTPTPTLTVTTSPTPTATFTPTVTPTATHSPTATPTVTATSTQTATATATVTPTLTVTATPTPTATARPSPTPRPPLTPRPRPTPPPRP
jgi:hypothetical protein